MKLSESLPNNIAPAALALAEGRVIGVVTDVRYGSKAVPLSRAHSQR